MPTRDVFIATFKSSKQTALETGFRKFVARDKHKITQRHLDVRLGFSLSRPF